MILFKKWTWTVAAIALLIGFAKCGTSEDRTDEEAQAEKPRQEVLTIADEMDLTAEQKEKYLNRGNEIAAMTFSALNTALMGAMAGEDPVGNAIQYCNVEAFPLTDSLAEHYGVKVQRLAEKYRNPANKISHPADEAVFSDFKTLETDDLRRGEVVKRLSDGSVVFYKPIPLQPQCMACHGPVSTIGEDNYATIKSLYPDDRAVDFYPGYLRGMWRITLAAR
jgi:hypothetical protein